MVNIGIIAQINVCVITVTLIMKSLIVFNVLIIVKLALCPLMLVYHAMVSIESHGLLRVMIAFVFLAFLIIIRSIALNAQINVLHALIHSTIVCHVTE